MPTSIPYAIRLAAAVSETYDIITEFEQGYEYVSRFDGGEISGPATARAEQTARFAIAGRWRVTALDVEDELNTILNENHPDLHGTWSIEGERP